MSARNNRAKFSRKFMKKIKEAHERGGGSKYTHELHAKEKIPTLGLQKIFTLFDKPDIFWCLKQTMHENFTLCRT